MHRFKECGGGVLVFATESKEEVDKAAETMNGRGALDVEELNGGEPNPGSAIGQGISPANDRSSQSGRTRQAGGGACLFSW